MNPTLSKGPTICIRVDLERLGQLQADLNKNGFKAKKSDIILGSESQEFGLLDIKEPPDDAADLRKWLREWIKKHPTS